MEDMATRRGLELVEKATGSDKDEVIQEILFKKDNLYCVAIR